MRHRKGNPLADNLRLLAKIRNDVRRTWGGAGVYMPSLAKRSKTLHLLPRGQLLQSLARTPACPCGRLVRRRRLSSCAALKRGLA